ncbi:hypothetical conserved protein [Oceanobacillus iheyensis HTE831]|uniref:Hypothetical conserved protein n=1 Tax=Oceanobacillus iheyensis (strain DSM 14371 / CIP 107618 / JCM 11309 / KCTC 3954 / HTE831) TaxID=221109 RepID=Q8ESC4_OCEIH|nr:NAD(P)-dependent oxidoreductase [Oceanobacillus iheyensis]BAC12673.1 hypothetical conserved protein [Oceanobacillus iheyensis HTE831]
MEKEIGINYVDFDTLIQTSDVIIVQTPLTKDTKNKFDKNVISQMKDDAVLVNCARGGIVEKEALAEAVKDGKIRYGGDVWYPQPAPKDHPWRAIEQTGLTVHYSGMTVEAQERIQTGVQEILTSYMNNNPINDSYLIVDNHKIANQSYQTQS